MPAPRFVANSRDNFSAFFSLADPESPPETVWHEFDYFCVYSWQEADLCHDLRVSVDFD